MDVPESTTKAHAPLFGFETPLFVRVFSVAADGTLGLPSPTVPLTVTFHARSRRPEAAHAREGATVGLPSALLDPDPIRRSRAIRWRSTRRRTSGGLRRRRGVHHRAEPAPRPAPFLAGIHYWRVRSFHGLSGPHTQRPRPAARSFRLQRRAAGQSLTIDVSPKAAWPCAATPTCSAAPTRTTRHPGRAAHAPPRARRDRHPDQQQPEGGPRSPRLVLPAGQGQRTFTPAAAGPQPGPAAPLTATLAGHGATAPLTVDPAALGQVFIGSDQSGPDSASSPAGPRRSARCCSTGMRPAEAPSSWPAVRRAASAPARATATGQLASLLSITTQQVTATIDLDDLPLISGHARAFRRSLRDGPSGTNASWPSAAAATRSTEPVPGEDLLGQRHHRDEFHHVPEDTGVVEHGHSESLLELGHRAGGFRSAPALDGCVDLLLAGSVEHHRVSGTRESPGPGSSGRARSPASMSNVVAPRTEERLGHLRQGRVEDLGAPPRGGSGAGGTARRRAGSTPATLRLVSRAHRRRPVPGR